MSFGDPYAGLNGDTSPTALNFALVAGGTASSSVRRATLSVSDTMTMTVRQTRSKTRIRHELRLTTHHEPTSGTDVVRADMSAYVVFDEPILNRWPLTDRQYLIRALKNNLGDAVTAKLLGEEL
jgi:hypothetical protein